MFSTETWAVSCYTYRVERPLNELKRFGAEWLALPELPNNPWGDDFQHLVKFMEPFDLIVLQRCYKLSVMQSIRAACDVLGKKLVYETDDDYFHLPPNNPCYQEMAKPGIIQAYAYLLTMADLITVSTKELKDVLYRFNKNIVVLGNNLDCVLSGETGDPSRAHSVETPNEQNRLDIATNHGFVSVPSYYMNAAGKKEKVVRIGYSGTPSHHDDWETVHHTFEKFLKKYGNRVRVIFIGDRYFFDKSTAGPGRKIWIPVSQYQLYMFHLRNIDVGLAPLVPNMFNMSKSEIKALEYASWGTPAVLPNYVTYTRTFTHGENCLTYYNPHDFYESLEEIVHNHELRERLGRNARDLVATKYLERHHAEERYRIYQSMITSGAKKFESICV